MRQFRRFSLLVIGLVYCSLSKAQFPTFQWASAFNGTSQTTIRYLSVDASGNTYISGMFTGTTDFDPGPAVYNLSSAGDNDAFFVKLNSAGNLVWAKRVGGPLFDDAEAIAVDNSGNVYITGCYGQGIDIDPGPGVYNLYSGSTVGTCYCNGFILKLDASGNFLWAGNFDSFIWSCGSSIKVDAASNVYVMGAFQSNIDLDPGSSSTYSAAVTSQDSYLVKLNSSGNLIWGETFGIMGLGRFWDMDLSGNFYFPGYFDNTRDFDPGPGTFTMTSSGNYDGFILKLNNTGNFIWAKQIGGSGWDQCNDVKLDAAGNIYVIGDFQNTADLDPGPSVSTYTSFGSDDIFALKLDNSGNTVWIKQIGSSNPETAYSLIMDPSGNPIFSGTFMGTVDFDPGPGTFNVTSLGSNDAYVAELTSAGNINGCVQIGGPSDEYGYNIALKGPTDLYTSGMFNGTTDFDPGVGTYTLTATGTFDTYVQKMNIWPLSVKEMKSGSNAKLFPNPTTGVSRLILKEKSNVIVNDVLGREVLNSEMDSGSREIDLRKNNSGLYFINIRTENNSEVIKLIKE